MAIDISINIQTFIIYTNQTWLFCQFNSLQISLASGFQRKIFFGVIFFSINNFKIQSWKAKCLKNMNEYIHYLLDETECFIQLEIKWNKLKRNQNKISLSWRPLVDCDKPSTLWQQILFVIRHFCASLYLLPNWASYFNLIMLSVVVIILARHRWTINILGSPCTFIH